MLINNFKIIFKVTIISISILQGNKTFNIYSLTT